VPGIEMTATGTLGWNYESFFGQILVRYAHPYSIINNNFPYNLAQVSGATAGHEHIGALWNADLHLSYDLPENFVNMGGWTGGLNVYMNVNNVLDTPPPYADVVAGYVTGNPIGRQFMFGIRKNF
jgi:outer membrane receptor protein involved in Fe transport